MTENEIFKKVIYYNNLRSLLYMKGFITESENDKVIKRLFKYRDKMIKCNKERAITAKKTGVQQKNIKEGI